LSRRLCIFLFSVGTILITLFFLPYLSFPAGTWRGDVRSYNERKLQEEQPLILIVQGAADQHETLPGAENIQTIPPPSPQTQQVQPLQKVPQEQAPQPPPAPRQFVQPAPQAAVQGRLTAKKGEVSFNFDDADVFAVIQTIFGDILKVNYVVDPSIKGRVNFRSVAPVAREDVLPLMEVILRLNGIGIVEEGGLYRIIPIGDLSREPSPVGVGRDAGKVIMTGKALLQVVPVRYIQSSELVRVLTPFLSKNAVIVDVPKSNYIILVDTDSNVKRLLQLVEIFDSEQLAKIKPQVYVYVVQNGKSKDVASLLQQIFLGAKPQAPGAKSAASQKPAGAAGQPGQPGQPAQAPSPQPQVAGVEGAEMLISESTRIIPDEITNTIIILSTPADYEIISEAIKRVDIVPRQVELEGLVVRIDLTDNLSFGLAWSMQTNVGLKDNPFGKYPVPLTGNIYSIPSGTSLSPTPSQDGFTFVATDPTGTVRARITAALRESKAKVLAAPHILVSDNREARIQVGSQVPLATSSTVTPLSSGTVATNTTTSTIQYKDIGVILKVKPQVNDSGLVALELSQEVSSLGDNVIAGGTENVSIVKTEASTNLVAQDGDTIIIGGMIQETSTKSKTGIPILSKLPLLGPLFSMTTDNVLRTELMILLTPRVIRSQQEAGDVTSDYIRKFKKETKDKQINEFLKGREMKKGDAERTDQGGSQKGSDSKAADQPVR
jgi:general secretion pathway protein D